MDIIRSITEMREWSRAQRGRGRIGFVPTMGYLHEGHLSLARKSLDACDYTVVSIFVNPMQFGPSEDLTAYPASIDRDRQQLAALGAHALFLPERGDIYPAGFKTAVEVGEITQRLCGAVRPGHFRGVATVVLKLFNIVQPQAAFFGEKDWQQLQVIRTLVRDLDLDIAIESLATVREADGLAMSSRNSYLSAAERRSALSLHRGLEAAKSLAAAGESSAEKVRSKIREIVERQPHTAVEYISVCDPENLAEREDLRQGKTLVALAVRVGKARLIDNCLIERNECNA